MVFDRQVLVFTDAIPIQVRRSEILRSCVPDIDVMDPQALDPVDMDDKCVNPQEAVKEALTTKTAGARVNPTLSTGGTVPGSPVRFDMVGRFWISSPTVVKLWVLKLIMRSLVVRRVVANLTMCISILPNSLCCY